MGKYSKYIRNFEPYSGKQISYIFQYNLPAKRVYLNSILY